MKEYMYVMYSFQYGEQAVASQASINEMAADGWSIHTCVPNFTEVGVMWERVKPKK